jgi:hypothetical protein
MELSRESFFLPIVILFLIVFCIDKIKKKIVKKNRK